MKSAESSPKKINNHVNYHKLVADGRRNIAAIKLCFLWKASLYKLVWLDLLIYVILYYVINFIYRFALDDDTKRNFEQVVLFCDGVTVKIPISFLLGFFVAGVIGRWWQMFMAIPWLNRIAFLVDGYVIGGDREKLIQIRLTILRYMNLSWVLFMRRISNQISFRFHQNESTADEEDSVLRKDLENLNKDEMVQNTFQKLITDSEIQAFENIVARSNVTSKAKYYPEYNVPMRWASLLVRKAFVQGYIDDLRTCNKLIEEIECIRGQMQIIQQHSSIMIPLVYTQVVIIAVYSYFLCQLMSSQFIRPPKVLKGHEVDFYIPIFTIFQFLFLMGWLKVAMCVMNPFGGDDEDFQTSDFLNQNLNETYRSAIADPDFYPDLLHQPKNRDRTQEGHKEDNLTEFLDKMMENLDQMPQLDVDEDMTEMVEVKTKCQRLKSVVCCKDNDTERRTKNQQNENETEIL